MKNLSIKLQQLGLASVFVISYSHAEEPTANQTENVALDKVVISAHSFDQGQDEMAQPASLLVGDSLERQRATSLGETLSSEAGINNSSYGSAVGRPVVRGMSGARVKVLQDGIDTLDASSVSPDHGINADMFSVKKVEVLRGPATLMYGSGAFGGVVNVVDERVPTGTAEAGTAVRVQYDTVNHGKTVAAKHEGLTDLSGGNELHWRISASHFESDAYEIPKLKKAEEHHEDESEEEHEEHKTTKTLANSDTSYNNAITLGSSYVFESGYVGFAISDNKSEYGLPGHVHHEEHEEGESEEEHEEHEGDGARIEMAQRRLDIDSRFDQPVDGVEALKFRIGFNNYRHDELEEGKVSTKFRRKGFEGRSEVLLSPVANISQAIGLQFSNDNFKAIGEEAVVPETDSNTLGLFWLGQTQVANWGLELGARLEQAQLSPEQPAKINASCNTQGLNKGQYKDKTFDTHSFSLGLVRDLNVFNSADWQLVSSVTSAQRAPATQELFSCGAHGATQTFDVGNAELKVEEALNIELGIRKTQGRFTTALNLYQNNVSDFIYAKNTGVEVDEFGQYKFVQKDATFRGGELNLAYQVLDGLNISAMADRVRVDNLPRIPADRIGLGFEASTMGLFSTQSDWSLFGQWQQTQKQDQLAEKEEATRGYNLVTLGLTHRGVLSSSDYRIDLKANNLLDEEVRQHTSFVKEQAPQAGRNVSLALALSF